MSKPETTFYTSVHRHLPSVDVLHREKMSNPYRGGCADFWYSGKKADLWIEWKFIVVPKRDDTVIDLCGGKKPTISGLQQDWLRGRFFEGRNVAVVVGCKAGGVIFPQPEHANGWGWEIPFTAAHFRRAISLRKDIAFWLQLRVS